ncbi:MAG: hypothetical protein AAF333_05815 [Planctomycetota bacterium]
MLGHFALQAGLKVQSGTGAEVVWVSHTGLRVAGLGLILRSQTLIAATFIAMWAFQTVWLADLAGLIATGTAPLGMVGYLQDADAWTRIGTSYHGYLLPVLGVVVWRWRVYDRAAWPMAIAFFITLTLLSRLLLDPVANVNSAFHLHFGETPLQGFGWVNDLPPPLYLPTLNALVAVFLQWPAAIVLRGWAEMGPGAQTDRCELGRAGVKPLPHIG